MSEEIEKQLSIERALGLLTAWLAQARIRADAAFSFNQFVDSLVQTMGGELVVRAPHGTRGKNSLIEMSYTSESAKRMHAE